ncbi:hypothetical protein H072_17 [Dactylellina haptotyla CBS 200.50]|uniref:N-acetyltransferase domain-containing protein n=1 Tax=Dactylellina haptotyla (strain CBS 200.50) TaxID=1284197 RepID=S8AYB6_DACHA|nr:hypothetical protein H072_17 [Dactylellina haptotyla CBS 200.50]
MQIRFATIRDIPAIATICCENLASDEVFAYIYPYRDDFPDDHSFYWQERIRSDIFDPSVAVIVAEMAPEASISEPNEAGNIPTRVVSFATWKLTGPCKHGLQKMSWKMWAYSTIFRITAEIQSSLTHELCGLRRDAHQERRAEFWKFGDMLDSKYYGEKKFKCSYHLALLATAEPYQRRGAATALINWAVKNAEMDGAMVGTEPNLLAEKFYLNRGFSRVGEHFLVSEGDPSVKLKVPVLQYQHVTTV